jgi:hypothetical protein
MHGIRFDDLGDLLVQIGQLEIGLDVLERSGRW